MPQRDQMGSVAGQCNVFSRDNSLDCFSHLFVHVGYSHGRDSKEGNDPTQKLEARLATCTKNSSKMTQRVVMNVT